MKHTQKFKDEQDFIVKIVLAIFDSLNGWISKIIDEN